mmetsp:Transcript_5991/g.24296  ORF Transcript_5991/g.24296 Transcript_5991/m.24296 type:complete len:233 (+) Transcript_5991:2460-3158(+)
MYRSASHSERKMCVPAPAWISPRGRTRIQSRNVVPGHSSMEMYRVYGQRAAAAARAAGVHTTLFTRFTRPSGNSRDGVPRPSVATDPVSEYSDSVSSSDDDDPESSSSSLLTSANSSDGLRTRPSRFLPGALESVSAPDAGAASPDIDASFDQRGSIHAEWYFTTLGSSISASARASLRSSSCRLSMASFLAHGGAALLKWIFFTATGRSSSRPTAATTLPNPPLPSILSSS